MAKLTSHDRDLRDARRLKGRLLNIKRLVTVLRDDLYDTQTQKDTADLYDIDQTLDRMLGRLSDVSMPTK